MTENYLYILSE